MQGELLLGAPTRPGGESRAALWVGSGAREVEAGLLAEVEKYCEEARRNPGLLARPVRIVVASDRLRKQLAAKLVHEQGASLAGVVVQTLFYVAKEALERSRENPPVLDVLFAALVREAAQSEAELMAELQRVSEFGSARDGCEGLVATVHDLIDAGFEPDLEEVLQERLAAQGSYRGIRRAQAIVRIAAQVLREFERLQISHRADLLRRAAQCIRDNPAQALPSRAILIHGFADATGVATDLLETLLRSFEAQCFFDWPRDPAPPRAMQDAASGESERRDPVYDRGRAWSEPLQERLRGATGGLVMASSAEEPSLTQIRVVRASGVPEEVREVACRVQVLLDAGAAPEQIAIVARDIEAYATALRSEFTHLGIPFSAPDVRGPRHRDGNDLLQLAQLLREREEARIELWISLCAASAPSALRADWLSAMTVLGVIRVYDLLRLQLSNDVKLPVYEGLKDSRFGAEAAAVSQPEKAESSRRRVAASEILSLRERFLRAQVQWQQWPECATLDRHQKELEKFFGEVLGWEDWQERFFAVRTGLRRAWPNTCEVAYATFLKLFEEQAESFGCLAFGGQGGGVQMLSIMDARACTFESLFVLGVQRGVFPRLVTEDALLADLLRSALREVLPDLPLKRRGFDEERFLFAQLCGSAQQVTLSYPTISSDGKPLNPSPFIERLRLAGVAQEADAGGVLSGSATAAHSMPLRSAFESALRVGLHGGREAFERHFVLAMQDAETSLRKSLTLDAGSDFVRSAAARVRILEELDPKRADFRHDFATSPYQGFVALTDPSWLRSSLPPVTRCEDLARCPWKFFLDQVLGVSAVEDLRASLFDRDALFGGNLVHAVLERIANDAKGKLQAEDAAPGAWPVRWPTPERYAKLWRASLEKLLRESDSIFRDGLQVQSEVWKAYLDVARAADWPTPESFVEVADVEYEASAFVEDGRERKRELRFRADRIDRIGEELRFTDYKTGAAKYTQKTPNKRLDPFIQDLRRGENLQVAAYVHSERARKAARAVGRYLYLKPDKSDFPGEIDSQNAEAAAAFREALAWILELWDRGVFFPRLFKNARAKEASKNCEHCSLRAACHQGDSWFRARFEAWADANRAALDSPTEPICDTDALRRAFQKAWDV